MPLTPDKSFGRMRPHRPADGRDERRWTTGEVLPDWKNYVVSVSASSLRFSSNAVYARLEFAQVAAHCPPYESQTGPRSRDLDGVIVQDDVRPQPTLFFRFGQLVDVELDSIRPGNSVVFPRFGVE
ncbi:hypothetical protein [Streptomyces sp. NBC_00986]|uniref:hypothetical protein n=1 Tax=Streptomyces sp. NBC_00986 TaxID=2903702 RepID=UPI00386BF7FA|nr:hypothetical protein OG504_41980 [Streptomyces sp. NBC_00986]